ncbi:MAG: ATP-binding protein [Anaerolineales bacterium]|nr:ATP-binding protein [Anaerolineales bacterium]
MYQKPHIACIPAPCGYFNDSIKPCICSPGTVTKYQKRISGPLLDRIDIHIEVPRVEYDKLSDSRLGESSEAVRARVEAARQTQRERFAAVSVGAKHSPQDAHPDRVATANASPVQCNSDMRPAEVRKFCDLDDTSRSLMKSAMSQLQLNARAYHRILKLARTIADLAGSERIGPSHLAEALQYRPRGMMGGA